ncbi:MAG: glycosyltransferase family 39 protein [Isosphaeraceae bacterium]
MGAKRALATLIAATTLARLGMAASIGPGNDEAYHWLYAVHLDWSYHDHPPMLAWVERLGMAAFGLDSWIGPRFGFVMLSAGSAWLLARIAARAYGEWAGFWAALALNAAPYYGLAAGTFALPDGPLLFFWLLTIDRLMIALEGDSSGRWAWAGLAWGGAMLSKYHALLLPAGVVLAMLWHAPWRPWFRRAGPYLATAIGLVLFSPVIFWNYRHGWGSFRFQGGRAVGSWQPRSTWSSRAVKASALPGRPGSGWRR